MKIPFFFLAILTTVAAFGGATSAKANPPVQQVVAVTSHPAKGAAVKKNPSRVPVSMGNYWDANQWDREGGASFWHATTEAKTQTTDSRAAKKAKKGGRFVKKLFNR